MSVKSTHHKVLTVGPNLKGLGGISSVLASYSRTIPGFSFAASNSRHGTIAGVFPLAWLLVRLPFFRMAGYDILHVHVATGKSYIRKKLIIREAQALGFRVIFHCHAGGFPAYAQKVGIDKISRFVNGCSAVAVLSEGWKKYFTETLGCKRVFVVDNIIEPPTNVPTRYRHEANDTLRLVFFGRMTKEKGFFDLLDAIDILKAEYGTRLKLTIGGDADPEKFNADMKARGLDAIIDYAGWVRGDAKDQILRNSDIVILPSYFEGIPITLLDAGAYLMPSIATNVGGIPEIITDGKNGTLVEPGKPEQLAAAIKSYLDDPGKTYSQARAANKNIAKHLPNAVAKTLEKMYACLE